MRRTFGLLIAIVIVSVSLWMGMGSRLPVSVADLSEITSVPSSRMKEREVVTLTHVEDGDTIMVDYNGRTEAVRFLGIDTPELKHGGHVEECFGEEAKAHLESLLKRKIILLEMDQSQGDRDVYKRLLRYVFTEDGTNINQQLLEDGFAYEYMYNKPYVYRDDFLRAEETARRNHIGVWDVKTCDGKRTVKYEMGTVDSMK